jgi:hypothetical protein
LLSTKKADEFYEPLRNYRLPSTSMRWSVSFLAIILLASLLEKSGYAASGGEPDALARVSEAITKRFCYYTFWERWEKPKTSSWSLELKLEGNAFLAWVDGIQTDATQKGLLLEGVIEDGIPYVKESSSFVTSNNSRETDSFRSAYLKARAPFETGAVLKDSIVIPRNCASLVDVPTDKRLYSTGMKSSN